MSNRPPSPPIASARGRVASLSRSRAADDPALVDARRDLKAATLEQHVATTVAAFPPLTDEQADRIAAILRGA